MKNSNRSQNARSRSRRSKGHRTPKDSYAPKPEALEDRRLLAGLYCPSQLVAPGDSTALAKPSTSDQALIGPALATDDLQSETTSSKKRNNGNGGGNGNNQPDPAGISTSTITGEDWITAETGTTTRIRVELDSQPTADVTVHISSSNPLEGQPDKTELVFTPDNWNRGQIVTVQGIDDADTDGHADYFIQLAPAISDDSNYDGLDATDVALINFDDESPVTNAVYIHDFDVITRQRGKGTDLGVSINVRHDSDADGVAEATDAPAAGVLLVISVYESSDTELNNAASIRNFLVTTDANGNVSVGWARGLSAGEYHIEVHDVSLDGFHWDPLDELETAFADADADARPDQTVTL